MHRNEWDEFDVRMRNGKSGLVDGLMKGAGTLRGLFNHKSTGLETRQHWRLPSPWVGEGYEWGA